MLEFAFVLMGRVEHVLAFARAHPFEGLFLPLTVLFLEELDDDFWLLHGRPRTHESLFHEARLGQKGDNRYDVGHMEDL